MSTLTLHNEKNKSLVPQLRFKEFDGKWEEKNLGDCINLLTDYHANGSYERLKENVELLEKEDYAIIIRTTNFEKKDFQKNLLYIDENAYNFLKKSKVQPDDIIINKIANAGATYLMPDLNRPVSLAMNLFLLRVKKEHSARYLFNQIKTKEHLLRALASGTGTKTITKLDVRNFELDIPSFPEQQKIASFLSALDEKTQQLSRKKELLEQYKKGVMQQLFSGKLRFKDENGEDYADWEERKLGSLTFKVGKKNKENIKYPIYSINNKEGFLPQSEQFDGLDSNDRGYDISLYKIVNSETFAYNPARINVGSIGYSYNLNEVIVSSLYVCFKTKEQLEDLYLLAYLDSYNFKKEILRFEEGGVRQYLFYENFSMIKIPLPSNIEQKKIATFLSSIDAKIESTNLQITQTQSFKKGLLQQMFA